MSDTLALADAWITYWRHHAETGKFPDSDGSEAVDCVVRDDPDAGWAVILAILERVEPKPENPLFQVLAAGPLEDLLDHHGPAVVERVDTEARRSPAFRLLLGGVWPTTIDRAVWSRLEKYRPNPW